MLIKEFFCFSVYDTHFLPCYFPGIKFIISLEGSFSCVVNGEYLQGLTSLILNRNVTHSLEVASGGVLIYYVDYHSTLEPVLLEQLAGRDWLDRVQLPTWLSNSVDKGLSASLVGALSSVVDRLMASQFPKSNGPIHPPGNWQIEPILQYIDAHIREPISLADLAPLILLSIERTRHLFIEQIGMPFSQYIIWMRLKLVINATFTQSKPLGELATYYGFVDPSHFQRLFKRRFGMNPNQLLKYSDYSLQLARLRPV